MFAPCGRFDKICSYIIVDFWALRTIGEEDSISAKIIDRRKAVSMEMHKDEDAIARALKLFDRLSAADKEKVIHLAASLALPSLWFPAVLC